MTVPSPPRPRLRTLLVSCLLGPVLLVTGAGASAEALHAAPVVASSDALHAAPVVASAGLQRPAPAMTYRAPVLTYRAPVLPLRVLRGFDPPAHRYGPGHLGVDLAAGGAVRAAGDGTVIFAGSVAGRGVVVVLHPDGIRTEYEPLRPAVTPGQQVMIGTVLGTVYGTHRGCRTSCLHWGARRGDTYLDPLSLLRPLGPVRLLPWGR